MSPARLCQLDNPNRAHNLTQTLRDRLCQLNDRISAHNLTQTFAEETR
jgi:hypothetical protein